MVDVATVIGFVAGALGIIAFVPQVVKSWKTKSTRDLSWAMVITINFCLILWIVYGIMISAVPIIVINIIMLVLMSTLLCLKIKYK